MFLMKIPEMIQTALSDESKKRNYYIVYTIAFFTLAFFVFSWFIFSGRSLIYQSDGWKQHFKALMYYAQYLRQIIRTLLFNHQLVIPDWDFYIGEGSDIVNALHYYVIGDPIALFSVFIPVRYMHIFYSFSCILRLYLAGLAFSELAFGTGSKNRYGILAGALSYSFCYWALLNVARHPYFLNPMIYFPFMILGIEKIIRKERPYVFILSAAISAASNFYFFYMIVILAIAYALIRLGFLYRNDMKKAIVTLLRMGVMAIIGVCMAGVLLLPVLMMFLQDSRMSVAQPFHLFYPLQYYSQLPSSLITNNYSYWLCMGFSAPVILALFIFFIRRKENRFLKVLFVICTIIILFPIGGRLLNGMSYMANRWSWAFALLCAYILVRKWEDLIALPESDWKKVFFCSIVFYVLCLFFDTSRTAATFSVIPLFFLSLYVMKKDSPINRYHGATPPLLVLMVGICAVNLGFWKYAPSAENYVAECIENRKIQEDLYNNEAEIVKTLSDEAYPRFTGQSLTVNANMLNHISSTQYYWSISNPYVNTFRSDLEMRESQSQNYRGYDDRTTPITLSSVQYYVTPTPEEDTILYHIPYGFTLIDSANTHEALQQKYFDTLMKELDTDELTDAQSTMITDSLGTEYSIYKNQYALPLGYCYDSYITQEVWDSLDAVQKQELQLETAYVNEIPEGITEYTGDISDYSIPFAVTCEDDGISETETGFVTTADKMTAVLSFEGLENAETYICFEGLEFTATPEYDLYSDDETIDPLNLYNQTNWELLPHDQQVSIRREKLYWNYVNEITLTVATSSKNKKTLEYKPSDAAFSSGRHNFIINLGYLENPITSITITFPSRGIYTIKKLQIYCVPMDGYAEKVGALQENTLHDINLGTDKITGKLDIDTPQLLCMAVPYSTGWNAFIDGEETSTIVTNDRYLGIMIPAGSHTIEFRYSMPYKHVGFMLSLAGFLALFIMVFFTERKRRVNT